MIFWIFSKVLLELFQSSLMKRSTTEFGSVLGPFLGMRLCLKSLQQKPIQVTSNNISKNRLVHRFYPSVHFDK